jgi:Xaa-Pro aminopeptidase
MTRGAERVERIAAGLHEADLDALICALPTNVLLLSGYWPVVGNALAIATRDGRISILAPEDEQELAERGWAGEVQLFRPGSLDSLTPLVEVVRGPLAQIMQQLGLDGGRIGFEGGAIDQPATYASLSIYGAAIIQLMREAAPGADLRSAAGLIARLRGVLTADEVDRVRRACAIAMDAFSEAAPKLHPGLRESEAAMWFESPLSIGGLARAGVARAGGFVYCMSGPNAAQAGAAYARTRSRQLQRGDLVLIHCNSYVDGYWTDITRTYCLGTPTERQREIYEAVFAARCAALASIRPGVRAAEVDAAARAVLAERGFGLCFTHATGHGVGFSAINGQAISRLHPASDDVFGAGMVFNVEPAVYIQGYGGVRHCDVVTVNEHGADVLTPDQSDLERLTLDGWAAGS